MFAKAEAPRKNIGSFVQIQKDVFEVLTFQGVICAHKIEFSERFQRQVKLYCYPFLPGIHLLSEVVVEFMLLENAEQDKTFRIERIIGDNREKSWNHWVESLSGLGPVFQGEKVEGIYLEQGNSISRLKFIQYQSPAKLEVAIVDLIRQSSAGRASGIRFSNGVHAVRAFGKVNFWRAVPGLEDTLNQPLSSDVRQFM